MLQSGVMRRLLQVKRGKRVRAMTPTQHYSTTLSFPAPSASSSSSSKATLSHSSTSWSGAISNVIFTNSSSNDAHSSPTQSTSTAMPDAPSPTLPKLVSDLLNELQMETPDPHQLMKLFKKIDINGDMHFLTAANLHRLLAFVHIQPHKSALSVPDAILRGRQYEARADMIRQRIALAGGQPTQGDLTAMTRQYDTLGYAPGACAVWDEAVQRGATPNAAMLDYTLSSFSQWIDLHRTFGGKRVARVTAEALVERSVAMLQRMVEMDGLSHVRITRALRHIFFVLRTAENEPVFTKTFKYIYGFDYTLPGADFASGTHKLSRRATHTEVCWLLEVLANANNISSMVAVFEVFDSPTASSSTLNSPYFDPSFHPPSPSASASTANSLIGTKAHMLLCHAASRLRKGAIGKHYYNQLSDRWEVWTDNWIKEKEDIMGITHDETQAAALDEAAHLSSLAPSTFAAPSATETTSLDQLLAESDSFSSAETSLADSTLAPPTAATPRPRRRLPAYVPPPPEGLQYAVPSELVYQIMRLAKATQNQVLSKRMRRAVTYNLRLMFKQTSRLEAIIKKNESTPNERITEQLPAIMKKIEVIKFHEQQLKLTYERIKLDSNVVFHKAGLRKIMDKRASYRRGLEMVAGTSLEVKKAPVLKRYDNQILRKRLQLVQDRIRRMKALGKEFEDEYTVFQALEEMQELRNKLDHKITGSWKKKTASKEVMEESADMAREAAVA